MHRRDELGFVVIFTGGAFHFVEAIGVKDDEGARREGGGASGVAGALENAESGAGLRAGTEQLHLAGGAGDVKGRGMARVGEAHLAAREVGDAALVEVEQSCGDGVLAIQVGSEHRRIVGVDRHRHARRDEFERRATAGLSHVVFANSPGGATATAERVATFRDEIEAATAGTAPMVAEPSPTEGVAT